MKNCFDIGYFYKRVCPNVDQAKDKKEKQRKEKKSVLLVDLNKKA
jgi:hypothetical protein